MFWRVVGDGPDTDAVQERPVSAENLNDARRRVLAALGYTLEPITREEFERMEAEALLAGFGPAISEACEVGEERGNISPCGGNHSGCALRERCPRWWHEHPEVRP